MFQTGTAARSAFVRGISFVRPKRKGGKKVETPQAPPPKPKTGLVTSKEAQRLLNAGQHLVDGAPPVPVPVLEEFFDDSDLYTRSNDTLKTPTPYATPQMAFAKRSSELKGVQSNVLGMLFAKSMLRKGPFFVAKTSHTIYYFPPWHPIALARRSRPGLVLCFSEGKEYNGVQVPKPSPHSNKSNRSRNPFTYAVWRGKTKRIFKRLFYNAWTKAEIQRDGLYLLIIDRVPEDEKQVEYSFSQFLSQAAKVKDFGWVQRHAAQAPVNKLNRMLTQRHYSPVQSWKELDWGTSPERS